MALPPPSPALSWSSLLAANADDECGYAPSSTHTCCNTLSIQSLPASQGDGVVCDDLFLTRIEESAQDKLCAVMTHHHSLPPSRGDTNWSPARRVVISDQSFCLDGSDDAEGEPHVETAASASASALDEFFTLALNAAVAFATSSVGKDGADASTAPAADIAGLLPDSILSESNFALESFLGNLHFLNNFVTSPPSLLFASEDDMFRGLTPGSDSPAQSFLKDLPVQPAGLKSGNSALTLSLPTKSSVDVMGNFYHNMNQSLDSSLAFESLLDEVAAEVTVEATNTSHSALSDFEGQLPHKFEPEEVPVTELYRFATPARPRKKRRSSAVPDSLDAEHSKQLASGAAVESSPTSLLGSFLRDSATENCFSLSQVEQRLAEHCEISSDNPDSTQSALRPRSRRYHNYYKTNMKRDREILSSLDLDPIIMPPDEILNMRVPVRHNNNSQEYKCPWPLCNVTAVRRYNLKIHYMTHVPVDQKLIEVSQFSCFVCKRVFRRRYDMQRHRFSKHSILNEVPDDGAGYDIENAKALGKKRK
ncbi:hypothetical protein HDU83_002879 [Entophlyctis luteolus]|nr:hypothetical protein HDU83_002879 [Entophlyctis luteolus]